MIAVLNYLLPDACKVHDRKYALEKNEFNWSRNTKILVKKIWEKS